MVTIAKGQLEAAKREREAEQEYVLAAHRVAQQDFTTDRERHMMVASEKNRRRDLEKARKTLMVACNWDFYAMDEARREAYDQDL